MKVLIDECLPGPLAKALTGHVFITVQEHGWAGIKNGELVSRAEAEFDLLLTGDKNLRYQQNLTARKVSILLLPTNHWPTLRQHLQEIQSALDAHPASTFHELQLGASASCR